jgi:hypothetical protein
MRNLAQADAKGCRAVLEAGFLDVLLAITFFDLRHDDSSLRTACNSALEVFAIYATDIYSSHPVRILWPKANLEKNHFLDRAKALKSLERNDDAVKRRIEAIEHAKCLFKYPIEEPRTLDMCADIIQFAWYVCQTPFHRSTS